MNGLLDNSGNLDEENESSNRQSSSSNDEVDFSNYLDKMECSKAKHQKVAHKKRNLLILGLLNFLMD
jgi:flagellar hook-basal body complex protein FliE